ncbi:hypothetical protein ACL7TT_18700 [Microbulbifer sp. 2304DJ12-6]|uniref:hypothetical protein n=1 Tax=Microbulbifer sp. 2304DJ12-6 TaxID=3233340 RepID=UPI0039B05C42
MATTECKPGSRLHQTKRSTPSDEASWQQLMVFNYVVFEAIDAMEQERLINQDTPLNHHWQQFVHHLRLKKPKLGTCLDNLGNDLLAKQEAVQ